MLVSHKYKFVFIHIHKNAGTFVTNLLKQVDNDLLDIYTNGNGRPNGHQTFEDIQEINIYDSIKNYTFFCVIRNPLDRLISWYNFTCENPNHLNHKQSFEAYLGNERQFRACSNLGYITNKKKLVSTIKLIKFDNLKVDLLNILNELNVETTTIKQIIPLFAKPLNVSKQIITKEHIKDYKESLSKNPILLKELIFWYGNS